MSDPGYVARGVVMGNEALVEARSTLCAGGQYLTVVRVGPRWTIAIAEGSRKVLADCTEEDIRVLVGDLALMLSDAARDPAARSPSRR